MESFYFSDGLSSCGDTTDDTISAFLWKGIILMNLEIV
jgi:hypothetical protein